MTKVADLNEVVERLRMQVGGMLDSQFTREYSKSVDRKEYLSASRVALPAEDRSGAHPVSKDSTRYQDNNGEQRFQGNKKKLADVIKELDNTEWTTIENKTRRAPVMCGAQESSASNGRKTLMAAKQKRSWHIWIGNLHPGTTADDVSSVLERQWH